MGCHGILAYPRLRQRYIPGASWSCQQSDWTTSSAKPFPVGPAAIFCICGNCIARESNPSPLREHSATQAGQPLGQPAFSVPPSFFFFFLNLDLISRCPIAIRPQLLLDIARTSVLLVVNSKLTLGEYIIVSTGRVLRQRLSNCLYRSTMD